MKPEIKELWVEALFSGRYDQTTGCLRNSKGYCCLGVLCDLYIKEKGDAHWVEVEDGVFSIRYLNSFGETKFNFENLPPPVYDWAGIGDNDIVLNAKGDEAAHLNDSGKTFKELADLIQQL